MAFVDLDTEIGNALRQELQTLFDEELPEFASCGLRPANLRSLRFVITSTSVMQGRISGLPPMEQLLQCPMIPNLVALARAKGWLVEDGVERTIRVRRADASPLPAEVLDFDVPEGHWLHVRGIAGPETRRIEVTLTNHEEHELLLQLEAPVDVIDAAKSWCDRVLLRQDDLDFRWLENCTKTATTSLAIHPSAVEGDDILALEPAIRAGIFETAEIHGNSMLPTVRDGDVLFVDKSRPLPSRGDIVVFSTSDGEKLVKRVIGLPGETLEISADGLRIDGRDHAATPTAETESASACGVRLLRRRLDDRWFDFIVDPDIEASTIRVPEEHVFVLGDNRRGSKDSRTLGPIPVRTIDGVASFVAWSIWNEQVDWTRTSQDLVP